MFVQISWTHALQQIVINCYKFHGREDLLPGFSDDDEKTMTSGIVGGSSVGGGSVGVIRLHKAESPQAHSPLDSTSQVPTVYCRLPALFAFVFCVQLIYNLKWVEGCHFCL